MAHIVGPFLLEVFKPSSCNGKSKYGQIHPCVIRYNTPSFASSAVMLHKCPCHKDFVVSRHIGPMHGVDTHLRLSCCTA